MWKRGTICSRRLVFENNYESLFFWGKTYSVRMQTKGFFSGEIGNCGFHLFLSKNNNVCQQALALRSSVAIQFLFFS